MKGKKIMFLIIGIVLVLIVFVLKKYYFLGSMNIHEYKNIMRYLDYYYPNNEFCVNNKEYRCIQTDGDKYAHLYKIELSDGDSDFYAIQCFKSSKRFEGSFIDDDYKTSIRDNYMRCKLNNYSILDKYENDFDDAVINSLPDYEFIVKDNNIDEIKEAITLIIENLSGNNNSIDVWFELLDSNSNMLCDGHDILRYCNENRTNETDVKDLVSDYIDKVTSEKQ